MRAWLTRGASSGGVLLVCGPSHLSIFAALTSSWAVLHWHLDLAQREGRDTDGWPGMMVALPEVTFLTCPPSPGQPQMLVLLQVVASHTSRPPFLALKPHLAIKTLEALHSENSPLPPVGTSPCVPKINGKFI